MFFERFLPLNWVSRVSTLTRDPTSECPTDDPRTRSITARVASRQSATWNAHKSATETAQSRSNADFCMSKIDCLRQSKVATALPKLTVFDSQKSQQLQLHTGQLARVMAINNALEMRSTTRQQHTRGSRKSIQPPEKTEDSAPTVRQCTYSTPTVHLRYTYTTAHA